MTSGKFSTHPVSAIYISADRQRKDLGDINELALSIRQRGLINPIVISRDGTLIAGERRLTAVRQLGWTSISVQWADELSDYEIQCIELEENIKRKQLTWQEEVLATEKLHNLRCENEPDWNHESTAQELGFSQQHVSRQLAVAAAMSDPKVAAADKFSTARNLVVRSTERRKANVIQNVAASTQTNLAEIIPEVAAEPEAPTTPLLNTSFHEWQPNYSGTKFNLIHCDFPYGINVADAPRMDAAMSDHYDDSPDVYWALLARLASAMNNVVAESAHLIFWFSMDYYAETKLQLERMGWRVNPFPLIWHKSDNTGIAPDPQRWPRRTYETALVASRGDRKLTGVGARSNSFSWPGSRDDAIHISEKPKPMLTHFLSMFCDEYSYVLDPTCGSAGAVKVALELGATNALGLEMSTEFYEVAAANWSK